MWPALEDWARQRTRGEASHRVSPRRVESSRGVSYRWLDNRFVLIGIADCTLHCPGVARTRRLQGCFGIHPASYEQLARDGVSFTIEATRSGGATDLLLERTLRPGIVDTDRGCQEFSVALPEGLGTDEIILRSTRQNSAAVSSPWAYWSNLRKD
jgi:hypothetical protein